MKNGQLNQHEFHFHIVWLSCVWSLEQSYTSLSKILNPLCFQPTRWKTIIVKNPFWELQWSPYISNLEFSLGPFLVWQSYGLWPQLNWIGKAVLYLIICFNLLSLDNDKLNSNSSLNPIALNVFPNNLWLYTTHLGIPSVFVWMYCLCYFVNNHHFRRQLLKVLRCFKNQEIVPI